ncbi:MAG: hypothetical protein L0H53_12955 [Candidatus Nitrosocosmicus sp.]|nr:hypothetical protein [Candidatus Nitrosocosmicus sp.]
MVLAYFGLGFLPIVIISAVFILGQWFFSDRIVLWSTGAKIVTKEQYGSLHSGKLLLDTIFSTKAQDCRGKQSNS